MHSVKAFGRFEQRKDLTYRTSTYLQWGSSEQSLGCFLLLNPGSALPLDGAVLNEGEVRFCEVKLDKSMEQMQKFIERVSDNYPIDGRVHIYNLFSMRNANSKDAIGMFEDLAGKGNPREMDVVPSAENLRVHPWICKCWGINSKGKWKHLMLRKREWSSVLDETGVPLFGKLHPNRIDYFHILPRLKKNQDLLLDDLVEIYRQQLLVDVRS